VRDLAPRVGVIANAPQIQTRLFGPKPATVTTRLLRASAARVTDASILAMCSLPRRSGVPCGDGLAARFLNRASRTSLILLSIVKPS